ERWADRRLIADIVFDIPIDHAFSYVIPAGLPVARGQRVSAPLHGRSRGGVGGAVREGGAPPRGGGGGGGGGGAGGGEPGGRKPLRRAVEPVPVLSDSALELTRW